MPIESESITSMTRGKEKVERIIHALRIVGIWISGLIASGCAGEVIGSAVKDGYDNLSSAGVFAGFCAFICFRLWNGERQLQSEQQQ